MPNFDRFKGEDWPMLPHSDPESYPDDMFNQQSAYERGYNDASNGKWSLDNPYDPLTNPHEHSDWENGHQSYGD